MIIQRKTQFFLALIITSVFFFQSCATIISGTTKKIPVASNPPGAKIIVDGEVAGNAPLNLKLKKKKGHIIRIEKQDYNPIEVIIIRKTSGIAILGDILWGGIGFVIGHALDWWDVTPDWIGTIGGAILGLGGSIYLDYQSGAVYTLSPKELNVTMSKVGAKSQSNFILIDAERFYSIKWIRIKCANSEEEEIIELN